MTSNSKRKARTALIPGREHEHEEETKAASYLLTIYVPVEMMERVRRVLALYTVAYNQRLTQTAFGLIALQHEMDNVEPHLLDVITKMRGGG